MSEALRILLVEDDEVDRLTVRRTLERADFSFEVAEATTVAAGLEALRKGLFDCALVDYHLPDGTGLDLLSRVQSLEEPTPIVILTGVDDEDLGIRSVKEGAEDYLVKGETTGKRLVRTIRHAIERHRQHSSSGRRRMAAVGRLNLLFGQVATELGYLSLEEVERCAQLQLDSGEAFLLGEICLKEQLLDQDTLREILTEQKRRLLLFDPLGAARLGDRLFGQLACKMGKLSASQLNRGLRSQAAYEASGSYRRLGEVLVALNLLTPQDVMDVLTGQGIATLACPLCLAAFNVEKKEAEEEHRCPFCGDLLGPDVPELKTELLGQLGEGLSQSDTLRVEQRAIERAGWLAGLVGGIWGPFEIQRVLGRGGMGAVFLARNMLLRRAVALKVPFEINTDNPEEHARFLNEARAAACLDHPNVVRIFSIGEVDGLPYIEMEHAPGRSLDVLLAEGKLDQPRILEIFVLVCRGIAAAHDRGVIHRDVKPENVLCCQDGRVLVTDFGLARHTRGTLSPKEAQALAGTIGYIAPEQLLGHGPDPRSDIYALGVLLFTSLTGRRPFVGRAPMEVFLMQSTKPPPRLREIDPSLPAWLEQVVGRMLEKDVAQRYQRLNEVLADIERGLAKEPLRPGGAAATDGAKKADSGPTERSPSSGAGEDPAGD
jgi:DNA-binding response OmpR family regulator